MDFGLYYVYFRLFCCIVLIYVVKYSELIFGVCINKLLSLVFLLLYFDDLNGIG